MALPSSRGAGSRSSTTAGMPSCGNSVCLSKHYIGSTYLRFGIYQATAGPSDVSAITYRLGRTRAIQAWLRVHEYVMSPSGDRGWRHAAKIQDGCTADGAPAACLVERCSRGQAGNAGADDDDHPLRRPKALQACAAYSSSALKRPRTRGPRDEVLHSASQLQSIFRLSMMRAAQAHS